MKLGRVMRPALLQAAEREGNEPKDGASYQALIDCATVRWPVWRCNFTGDHAVSCDFPSIHPILGRVFHRVYTSNARDHTSARPNSPPTDNRPINSRL